jgi:hypothetical protein
MPDVKKEDELTDDLQVLPDLQPICWSVEGEGQEEKN